MAVQLEEIKKLLLEIADMSNLLDKEKGNVCDQIQLAASYWRAGKHGSLPRDMLESRFDCINECANEALKRLANANANG